MTSEAAIVFETLHKAFGRPPEEHDVSFYLHRMLVTGVPLAVIQQEIRRAADERFVHACWRTHAGREPSPEELERDVTMCGAGRLGREALLRRFLPDSRPDNALDLDGEAFIRSAWRSVAGREPDAGELAETRRRIVSGELSKQGLLRELGAPVTRREEPADMPFVGRLLRIAALIWKLPSLEREIAALRHRVADLDLDNT